MRGAFADGVDFTGAEFYFADMRGISFSSEEIGAEGTIKSKPTTVSGAKFYGADLRDTDLRNLVGLTSDALEGACLDENPKLPPSIKTPEHCTLEVGKGEFTTKHPVPFIGGSFASAYLLKARACGLDGDDQPAAIRITDSIFRIKELP
jgi:hypothetical protein